MYQEKRFYFITNDVVVCFPGYLEKEHAVDLLYDLSHIIELGDSANFEDIVYRLTTDMTFKIAEYGNAWLIYDDGDMSVGITGSNSILAAKYNITPTQLEQIRLKFETYNDFKTYVIDLKVEDNEYND